MNLIEQIKKWFNKKDIKDNNISHIESINLAIIDTTGLKIDRSLTKEENESRKKFLEELSLGNFSTFINYGNEISKEINYYMEICRKRIDQGINSNKELARNISTKNIIAEKIKIIFNKAEIENIIDELNGLKRTCELRVIALEEFGNGEIKRRKKKIHFLDNKTTDESKINTINNTISRISAIIKIIDTLICSLNIEKNNYLNENSSLDIFINASDSNSTKEIANNVLIETFYELKSNLASIASFTNISSLNFLGTPINEINIESGSLSIKSKINIIALLKRYLDLYIEQNKKHLLANGGLLERANISLNSLIDEIESDYLDIDLWAKKAFGEVAITNKEENSKVINTVYNKYYKRLNNIQRFLSIFEEAIPESFKDRFYRTKFNFYALYIETFKNDAFYDDNPIKINNEEERKYFLKFIEEIIDRIHRRSNDGELLKFMNKHLSLKNRDSILDKYYKFATLLRIDKYGRDGLFTLMLYTANFKNKYNHICCLDQIEPKYLQYVNLQFHQVKSNSMAQDILKLWKPSNNHFSRFWGDMDENWDLARKINDGLYSRSDHANIQFTMNPDYRKFLIEKMQDYNKFARKNNIKTKDKYINFFGNQICKVQYIAMYAYMMERFSNGLFPREQIFKKLIQADNDKNLYNFNYITEKILINYLKENLNKVDYKHFINKFKSQLHGSENLIGILKSIDREKNFDFLIYSFIINSCKEFNGRFQNITHNRRCDIDLIDKDNWIFTEVCLLLDNALGKENVRDELLNYEFDEHIEAEYFYSYPYTADSFYSKRFNIFNLTNKKNNVKAKISTELIRESKEQSKECIEQIVKVLIFNKLINENNINNDKYINTALWLSHCYTYYLLGYSKINFSSIRDKKFENLAYWEYFYFDRENIEFDILGSKKKESFRL